MSLINDALKQAKKAQPRQPHVFQPLQPAVVESASIWKWFLPGLIVLLVVAGVGFIGWSVTHRPSVAKPAPVVAAPVVAAVPEPVVVLPPAPKAEPVAAAPVAKAPAPKPARLSPPPVLQGIFYSPAAPSAIMNGKTVRPGDRLDDYLVKTIGKSSVTLMDSNSQEIKLNLGR